MKTWWIGAALAAMCVAQSAWAQYPHGDGMLPEPVPVAPAGGPGPGGQKFMPGPLTGSSAPPGPDEALSLPADISTAWGKGPIPEEGLYVHLGGMGLMRQRPGRSLIAVDQRVRVTAPAANYIEVQDTADLDPSFAWGGRATVGYLCDDAAIELTGFILPYHDNSVSFSDPGHLQVPFFHPISGFVGATGIGQWTNANTVMTGLQTFLGNSELNYRWWSRALTGVEGIVGFRYVEMQEKATIFTDDSGTVPPVFGAPNRAFMSTYLARVDNHLLMPQTGFEWDFRLTKWLSFGVMGKAGFGADDVEVTTRLTNGLGVVGFQARHSEWTYSSLYEANAFFDILALEKMHIRAGWTALWLLNVAEGLSQVNFDLTGQPGRHRDHGSIFYQGPMVEVQFLF